MKKTSTADRAATATLISYTERFAGLRGHLPRITIPLCGATLQGWPVRNPDGGESVAYFTSRDAAEAAIFAAERAGDKLLRAGQAV